MTESMGGDFFNGGEGLPLILSFLIRGLMLFLTNELAKKPEITILPARETTGPGLQAGASWVERKGYIRGSVARDSHLGL